MAAAAVAVIPDLIAPNSPADAVSSLHFAPRGPGSSVDYLCASSWDCSVSVWEVGANGDCVPRAQNAHGAPVLCTAWSADASSIISGGCDNSVRLWQVATNQSLEIGKHDAPVRCVFDLSAAGTAAPSIASLSWDKSCRYWDARSAAPGAAAALTVPLADKAYAADVQGVVLAVACAERHVQIFDLRRPDAPVKSMASPLKFQSRAIALFPDQTGFALGSIEGRVSIQYISDPPAPAQPAAGGEPQPDPRNFAFKCHRQGNEVFSVNGICFHPNGTFATVGGDGVYTTWDKDSKQRLKLSAAQGNSLTCAAFNPAGTIFAYGVGNDGSRGDLGADKTKPTHVALHKLTEVDIGKRQKA